MGMRNVALCGLVKFYKPPSKSRGPDCYIIVHIVDESSPTNGITCVIFNPSKDKLANVGSVGAIALIKGVHIEMQRGGTNMQGLGHEHTLVGLFAGAESSAIPDRIGSWYELRSDEKKRIEELRLWSKREGPFLLNSQLEEVTPGHYFNTVCQVAAMAVLQKRREAVLSVFDGTSSNLPIKELSLAESKEKWEFDSDPELYYTYRLLTYDVWLSGIPKLEVLSGDIVNLINVYSYEYPPLNPIPGAATIFDHPPPVELRLFNRESSIVIFKEDSREAMKFEESLPVIHGVFPSWRSPSESDLEDEGNDIVRTIIMDDSIPRATLGEIKQAENGGEFLASVQVKLVKPETVDDICDHICPSCGDRGSEVRQAKDSGILQCPKDGATLQYELSFYLLLHDRSGELEVVVNGTESQRLFSKIFINGQMAANRETKERVLDVFYKLTGGNDPFFALPADPRYSYTPPEFLCTIKKVINPSEASNGGELLCNYRLVNTIIDQS